MEKIKCLDNGFVEYMTHTQDGDLLVVNAARCSFDKQHEEFDPEADGKLIHYLARHKHLLPFRHPSLTIRVHMPIFVARQAMKHQVGMSWSEVSRRYIKSAPDFEVPATLRKKADNVKQGSSWKTHKFSEQYVSMMERQQRECLELYEAMLEDGVAPEQARSVLPQSMYTTAVWTGTLLAWSHFCKMRSDSHAQREIQVYAEAVDKIAEQLFPVSWLALKCNV